MDGFEKRRQQKKDSILKAARELYKQYGYKKVSVAEIAKRASVSQVSIYNFFGSKENLKQELSKKLVNDNFLEMMDILKSHDNIKLKFEKLLISKINFLKSIAAYFFPKYLENDISFEENLVEQVTKKFKDPILSLVEEGKKKGIFDDSISVQAITTYLEIIQYYFFNNPSALAKFDNNPELTKEIPSLFLNALMKSN
jgi:AcrR family transcriptional regulator